MKKVYLAIVLAGSLALGACVTTGVGPAVTAISALPQAKQLVAGVREQCQWILPLATASQLISNAPILVTVGGVVNDVCSAVTTAPLADGPRRRVVVYGVVVGGRRVR